ncbi:hypothetical protein MMC09_000083 [Bachmanniomyces sp. S44760]|nr:hypothetical protein [Bachmanniomyces sp. S44760]
MVLSRNPRNRLGLLLSCPALFVGGLLVLILVIVYGMRSDYDEMHPFLGELLPAGHCLCHSSVAFECASCLDRQEGNSGNGNGNGSAGKNSGETDEKTWEFVYGRDDTNEALTRKQCQAAFPGAFEDVQRAVELRRKEGKNVRAQDVAGMKMYKGMVKAMIFNGELYVEEVRCMGEDHRKKVVGVLSSIYRALTAIPTRRELPNIEFAFTIEDMADDPSVPIWALTRRIQDEQVWLMPDFGFWSWNLDGVGPYGQVVDEIKERDVEGHWETKEKKLVWRGKLSFAPKLRRALLAIAKDKPWSAVRALRWWDKKSMQNDFVSSVDQCNYMFIAHAEGRSYSAGLKYRQACRSVIVAHKLQWIQNHHYLMVADGPHQNFVEVERDFSDLESKIEALLANQEEAKRIADNSVKVFRERYLTPAAEACYWRELFRGWAEVSFVPELYEDVTMAKKNKKRMRGLRHETFILLEDKEQLQFKARDHKLTPILNPKS